jgi:hypothetical protein
VVAEISLVKDATSARKRKRSTTLSRRLKHHGLSQPGQFVFQLPLDLPAGEYSIRMISTTGQFGASEALPIEVVHPAPSLFPEKAPHRPRTERFHCEQPDFATLSGLSVLETPRDHSMLSLARSDSSNQLFRCDSSLTLGKQFSTSWPESKALGDDVLPTMPPVDNSTSYLKNGLDLVPSNSEMSLSYRAGANGLDLTRSVSEENLAKMAANCDMFSDVLGRSGADVANIMWLNGPNLDPLLGPGQKMETDEEPETGLLRTRSQSLSLCRQVSDGNVLQFLADEGEPSSVPAAVQSAA